MQETTAGSAHAGNGVGHDRGHVGLAAERYGERPAVRFKRDGEWRDMSYAELGERLGDRPRARSTSGSSRATASPCCARPASSGRTWTSRSRPPAPSWSRSTRPTRPRSASGSSGNSESRVVVCEDAAQVAKIRAVRERLPALETIVVDRARGERRRDRARRRCASAAARATRRRSPSARGASRATTRTRSSTRRARPGRRRAACSRHGNYRDVTRMCEGIDVIAGGRDRLPLPAARALLRAAHPAAVRRPRRDARLLGRRPAADRPRAEGQADLPAVGAAHLREDLHARHLATATSSRSPARRSSA